MCKIIEIYSKSDAAIFGFYCDMGINGKETHIASPCCNDFISAAIYMSKMLQAQKAKGISMAESFLQINPRAAIVARDDAEKYRYVYNLFGPEIFCAHVVLNGFPKYPAYFRGNLSEFIRRFGGCGISASTKLLAEEHNKNQAQILIQYTFSATILVTNIQNPESVAGCNLNR